MACKVKQDLNKHRLNPLNRYFLLMMIIINYEGRRNLDAQAIL